MDATFENQKIEARRILAEKGWMGLLNPHGMIGRVCRCGDCFCCAAVAVLGESPDRLRPGSVKRV